MQLFKGSYFSVGAALRHYGLIWLSQTVQRTYFITFEFCFTCFKVEYKKSYIFQKCANKTLIFDI